MEAKITKDKDDQGGWDLMARNAIDGLFSRKVLMELGYPPDRKSCYTTNHRDANFDERFGVSSLVDNQLRKKVPVLKFIRSKTVG